MVVNVTATGPTAKGWLTVFNADDAGPPTASNLNFLAGQTVPNLVKISVGQFQDLNQGKFKIANTAGGAGAGSVQIIVDLVGYYTGNGSL